MFGSRGCSNAMMAKEMAPGTDYAKELRDYKERCLELEKKNKKAEMWCFVTEVQVGNLKKRNEELEEQITRIRKVLSKGEKGKGMIIDLSDSENENKGDKFVRFIAENHVLEFKKTKAEDERNTWKEKVNEMVSRVCELESIMSTKAMNESTGGIKDGRNPVTGETHLDTNSILIGKDKSKQVRKRLQFEEGGYTNKEITPSTPGVIHVKVEDANFNEISKVNKLSRSSNFGALAKSRYSSKNDHQRNNLEVSDEDNMDVFEGHSSPKRERALSIVTSDDEDDMNGFTISANRKRAFKIITSAGENDNNDEEGMDGITISAKRKRALKIVTSDNETGYDDNAPICTLITPQKTYSEDEVKAICLHGNTSSRSDFDMNKAICLHENTSSRSDFGMNKAICLYGNTSSRSDFDMRKAICLNENTSSRSDFDMKKTNCLHGNTSSEDEEDEDWVENGTESEGESLGGFILASSESACDSSFESDDSCNESEDASDNFRVALDKIRRK